MKKITVIKSDLKNDEMPLYTQAIVNNKKKFIKFMSLKNIEIRPLTPSLNFAKYLSFKKIKISKIQIFFIIMVSIYHQDQLKSLKIWKKSFLHQRV